MRKIRQPTVSNVESARNLIQYQGGNEEARMLRSHMPQEGQQTLSLGNLSSQQFEPVRAAHRGAVAYTQAQGQGYRSPDPQLQQDPRVGFAVGQEYSSHIGTPVSPRLRKSYGAMQAETSAQYEHMTRPKEHGGLGIHHTVTTEDPYPTAAAMADDVRSGHLKTFASESTGEPHAFMGHEGTNKFRAVHDFFGHAATGRGFTRHGEEAAWRSHVQMYSRQAREAVTSETRGQNTLMNYSSRGDGFLSQANAMVPMSRAAQNPNLSSTLDRVTPKRAKPQGRQLQLPGFGTRKKLP